MTEDRLPPQDNDAEQSVLGAMILSKTAIGEVAELLTSGEFYRPAHGEIYDVILAMYLAGDPVDPVTLSAELRTRGMFPRVGDSVYIHTLSAQVQSAATAAHYAEIVVDKAVRRRIIEASIRNMQRAYSGEGDTADVADAAVAEMMGAVPQDRKHDYAPIGDAVESTFALIDTAASGERLGVPTGFVDLDDLFAGGLMPGQMVIIAGRPGSGKSTLGLDICRAVSIRHRLTSVFFSLEMTRQEITMRCIAAQAKVPLSKLRDGVQLSDDDWNRISVHLNDISTAPLFIDDSAGLNMSTIRAKARRLKQEHDLRVIVIDYVQLMTSGAKVENRQVEVSEFSRQVKLLAKELEVPIVALSQLNRGVEQRADKRPVISDLRESGSLEADSDIVILLHRPDMYEMESDRPGEADFIVAKHRNGPMRDLAVAFQGHLARFVSMATE